MTDIATPIPTTDAKAHGVLLTDAAAEKVKSLLQQENRDDLRLRVADQIQRDLAELKSSLVNESEVAAGGAGVPGAGAGAGGDREVLAGEHALDDGEVVGGDRGLNRVLPLVKAQAECGKIGAHCCAHGARS